MYKNQIPHLRYKGELNRGNSWRDGEIERGMTDGKVFKNKGKV